MAVELQQVIGHHETAGEIVDSHQIKLAPAWEAAYVAVQKRYRDSGLSQAIGQFPIHLLSMFDMLERREEHAGHFPVDEPSADLSGVMDAGVGVQPRMHAAAPQQVVVMGSGEAGQFPADDFKDLRNDRFLV